MGQCSSDACSTLGQLVGRQQQPSTEPMPPQQYYNPGSGPQGIPLSQLQAGGFHNTQQARAVAPAQAGCYNGAPLPQGVPVAYGQAGYYGAPTAQAMPMAHEQAAGYHSRSAVPCAQAVPFAQPTQMTQPMSGSQGVPVAVPVAMPLAGRRPSAPVQLGREQPVQLQTLCPGQRKSLLVGINYFGSSAELGGCINDVQRMRPVLQELGFPANSQSQMVLLDDGRERQPTRANIIAGMRWLTSGVQTGDALWFHYSGHGGRERCDPSEAADGHHETLCPVDYQEAGEIYDTEIFELLVRPLPSGVKLTCLMDCCHSGGVVNLPYLFIGTAENLKSALAGQAAQIVMGKDWASSLRSWQSGNPVSLLSDVAGMGLELWKMRSDYNQSKGANEAGFVTTEAQNAGLNVGEVVCFTGCRSDQTSADVGNVSGQFRLANRTGRGSLNIDPGRIGAAGGALTSCFIESLESVRSGNLSYLQLLEQMRQRLANEGFEQVPQLATSLLIELQQPFSIDKITLPPQGALQGGGSRARGGPTGAQSFMSTLCAQPTGSSMIQRSNAYDGSSPYEALLAAGGGMALGALLEQTFSMDCSGEFGPDAFFGGTGDTGMSGWMPEGMFDGSNDGGYQPEPFYGALDAAGMTSWIPDGVFGDEPEAAEEHQMSDDEVYAESSSSSDHEQRSWWS